MLHRVHQQIQLLVKGQSVEKSNKRQISGSRKDGLAIINLRPAVDPYELVNYKERVEDYD